ncbi:hypothetical protein GQ55_6G234600 [Panicum hallii var. hallii]|uniref:Uncharacterized protein n=1 Tax=Panicum hallii var. hallii TaxID=1504633 RepID=A0A2T7D8Q4_9POAL|nr:hypothetical protein GQ55_6G234600 [Panicum hallii var. hallii]
MARRAAEQTQPKFAPGSIASGLVMMATINEVAGWRSGLAWNRRNWRRAHLRHGEQRQRGGWERERARGRPIPDGSVGGSSAGRGRTPPHQVDGAESSAIRSTPGAVVLGGSPRALRHRSCARRPARTRGDRRGPPDDARQWLEGAAVPARAGGGCWGAMCAWRRRGRDATPTRSNSSGVTAKRHHASTARAHGRAERERGRHRRVCGCARGRRDSLRDASRVGGGRGVHAGAPPTRRPRPPSMPRHVPCARAAPGARGGVRPAAGARTEFGGQSRAGGGHMWGQCARSELVTRRMFQSL